MDASLTQVVFTFISLALSIFFSKEFFNSIGVFFADLAEGLRGFVIPIREIHEKYKAEVTDEFITRRSYDKNDFLEALNKRILAEVENKQNAVREKALKIIFCNMTILQLLILIALAGFFSRFMADVLVFEITKADVVWTMTLAVLALYVPYFIWQGVNNHRSDGQAHGLLHARYPLLIFLVVVLTGWYFLVEWLSGDLSRVAFLIGSAMIVFVSTHLYRIPHTLSVFRNDGMGKVGLELTDPENFKSQLKSEFAIFGISAWVIWGIHIFFRPLFDGSESAQKLIDAHYPWVVCTLLAIPPIRMICAYLLVIGKGAFQVYFEGQNESL